jgi:phosphate transport system substrate-binding protein
MKKMKNNWLFAITVMAVVFLSSCGNSKTPKTPDETPTSGKIRLGVDESFTQIIDAEIDVFQSLYKNASIIPIYKPEQDIIGNFLADSLQNVVVCRKLTQSEEDFLKSKQIYVRATAIAHDGIAFIVNPSNTDTLITFDAVKRMITGAATKWEQIGKHNTGALKIVFDNHKSANVRYLQEKFGIKGKFPATCAAVDKNNEVINYVKKNRNAIGIISVNWISDKDDSLTHAFLKQVKVMAVGSEFDSNPSEYYKPYQAYIANGSYPFVRDVFMLSRETFSGLGSGFISFIAGEKGQRIVLKSGMVPATMPVRIIQIKNQ